MRTSLRIKQYIDGERCGIFKSCFVAGTPLLTPSGSKPIEEFRVGDEIVSRSEFDPEGPLETRRVLQRFVRTSPVLNLHARGRIVGTTGEHPFWVVGKGWVRASSLRIGDELVSADGQKIAVEGIAPSGRTETVYNLEVEADHTYFVGEPAWHASLWAHNAGAADYEGTAKSLTQEEAQSKLNEIERRLKTEKKSLTADEKRQLRDERDALRQHLEGFEEHNKTPAGQTWEDDQHRVPASEDTAKAMAHRVGRELGSDARERFHDAKTPGHGDRTLGELIADANELYRQAGRVPPKWPY